MKSSDVQFMRCAIEKARKGIRQGQTPFGACIGKGGTVISCAHNLVWKTNDITAHAEIVAIRRACRILKTVDLSGCILYSTCEPCPMCFSAAHWARISVIKFGARIRDAKKAGFNELAISCGRMKGEGKSAVKVYGGILAAENCALLREWAHSPMPRLY